MKCPECVKEGKKSSVLAGSTCTTLMGWMPYYDEEGEYHSHDPNYHSTPYSCSNGHNWGESHITPCPAKGCEYGKEGWFLSKKVLPAICAKEGV